MVLVRLAKEHHDVAFIYPVHLHPLVRRSIEAISGSAERRTIFLIDPVDYPTFVALLKRCYLVWLLIGLLCISATFYRIEQSVV